MKPFAAGCKHPERRMWYSDLILFAVLVFCCSGPKTYLYYFGGFLIILIIIVMIVIITIININNNIINITINITINNIILILILLSLLLLLLLLLLQFWSSAARPWLWLLGASELRASVFLRVWGCR